MFKNTILGLIIIIGFSSFIEDSSVHNQKNGIVLDGTDVVSILNSNPCIGSAKWSIVEKGLTYYFCSEENKITFKENTEKYIPAFGGWCAFALIEKPQQVAINIKTFKIVNGKLLLFYNAWGINTLEKWNALNNDSENYKLAAENWAKLKAGK